MILMKYKDYTGSIEADEEQGILHGQVLGTTDVITFQGKTVNEVKRAFHESVDDYLAYCAEKGKEPDTSFSGKFVVRIAPELHSRAAMAARESSQSLNAWVKSAIEATLKLSSRRRA